MTTKTDTFVALMKHGSRALQASFRLEGPDRLAAIAASRVASHYALQLDTERWTVRPPAGQVPRRSVA
jgi:hypothetical protein